MKKLLAIVSLSSLTLIGHLALAQADQCITLTRGEAVEIGDSNIACETDSNHTSKMQTVAIPTGSYIFLNGTTVACQYLAPCSQQ